MKVAKGRVHRHLRRRLHPDRRLPAAHRAVLRRPEDRDGAGALGPHQPGLLAADEDPVDPARRALRARARQPQPRRPLLQLQRHRRHLAPRGDHRRRRLAARHAHRGSRPQLPRAAARLEVRVPAQPGVAGRAAGRDELVQVAAAPLGEGLDPDLPQAAAADPALEHLAAREGRGVLPPHRQLQLPAHVRAVGADGAVDGHPLQHGLVRDAAHRRAAVLRGHGVGGQFLHGLPARAAPRLDHPPQVPAVPDVDRHRSDGQQHQGGVRGDLQAAERVRPHAEVPHRSRQRRVDRQEVPPELRGAADHRAGARPLLHGHGLLRARQRHLRHRAVPRALPDRVPLHGPAVDHPAVRG